MPPKADPSTVSYVVVRGYGGEPVSSAVLAPKLGPLGIPPKKAADDISKATQQWKGVKVTTRLKIQNRQIEVELVPTATALVIKALKEPIRDRKKVKNIKHSGNLNLDTIIDIARNMRQCGHGIPSKSLQGTVMEILGTCNAIGCTVAGKKPTELQKLIKNSEVDVPAN